MLCGANEYELSARERQLLGKGKTMKPNWEDDYEMQAEYDLTKVKMIRNPFVQHFQELNLVSLDDDVKAVFSDSESVNIALRSLIKTQRDVARRELSKAS
jgi:hypothetical protein